MSSSNQVVFEFIANDNVSSTVSSIGSSIEGIGMAGYAALQEVGQAAQEMTNELIEGASNAQQAWIAFGNSLSNVSGGTADLSATKTEVVSLANTLGRSTSEVRQAETTMMNMGASYETAAAGVRAASAASAGSGKDFTTVTSAITSALKGRGAALKELGFDIADYKDAETGAIDSAKLYSDILAKYGNAQDQYATSFASASQRLENSVGALKTSMGQGILSVLTPLAPVVEAVVGAFNALPSSLKAIAGISIGAVGGLFSMSTNIVSTGKAVSGMIDIFGPLVGVTKSAEAGFFGLSIAEDAVLWPILAIIVAVIALVAAMEQIGIAMGWWSDFSTMIEAIQAGLTELWNVFMNSQQVQGTIQGIKEAFSALWQAVGPLITKLGQALGLIGEDAQGAQDPLNFLVQSLGHFLNICGQVYNFLKPVLQILFTLFVTYVTIIIQIIMTVIQIIQTIWSVVSMVVSFVVSAIMTVISVITMILNAINTYIISPLSTVASAAQSAFSAFASAVNTVLGPLQSVYDWLCKGVDKLKEYLNLDSQRSDSGSGGEIAIAESEAYHAMLQSKGITAKVGNTSKTQTVQFNIDTVDVSANNLSPTEAKNVMITALESLNNVEGVKLKTRRRTV